MSLGLGRSFVVHSPLLGAMSQTLSWSLPREEGTRKFNIAMKYLCSGVRQTGFRSKANLSFPSTSLAISAQALFLALPSLLSLHT